MFKLNPSPKWYDQAIKVEKGHDFVIHPLNEEDTMYYTGIGSRSTSKDILAIMTDAASKLEAMGYTLRSGGAGGADAAFEKGVQFGHKEIFLPWPDFNDNKSPFTGPSQAALVMAERYHPAWNRCGQGARKLHARNCHQVLGWDLQTPSQFIACWTPGGELKGGTAQALRIALDRGIAIFNLAKPEDLQRLLRFVNEGKQL